MTAGGVYHCTRATKEDDTDVLIVGGGHNALVAAAYLGRTGRRVTVLEARPELGGAVSGGRLFPGLDAQLSRFAYLVSVLPDVIIDDLGLRVELRSRRVASYSPAGAAGLLVERPEGRATRASFAELTGDPDAYGAWSEFHAQLADLARVVAPTLTEPLPRAADLRTQLPGGLWRDVVERPIGEVVERTFADDTVRGTVLTDALIGTFADAHDPSLVQNRCLLYHVIGNGSGEWRVPVGGMGRVAAELVRVAADAGAELRTGAPVSAWRPEVGGGGTVTLADGSRLRAPYVLLGCAPAVTDRLLGRPSPAPEGSQVKINLLLRRLPRVASGLEPETAFAGTLHLAQGYAALQQAYATAAAGVIPDPLPSEVYCHSLTDPSVLAPDLAAAGFHTLTLFGVHAPARLFRADPDGARERVGAAALGALQSVLAEPLDACLARDADGQPCVEVVTPLDLEAELNLPGGHIFHGDLVWPWLADGDRASSPAQAWGVATEHPGVLRCGSGAVRGGAVSGLGGHNAAMAVLDS